MNEDDNGTWVAESISAPVAPKYLPMVIPERPKPVSEQNLWRKITRFASRAGLEVIEKVLWLHYAAQKPTTPLWAKSVMYGAVAYFLLPVDAIPDFLPGTGFTDDLGALAAAVGTVSFYIDDEIKARARARLRHWFKDL